MKFGDQYNFGKNVSANEKDSYRAPAARGHSRCSLPGLPRSEQAGADGAGVAPGRLSLDRSSDFFLRHRRTCRGRAMADSPESPGYQFEHSAYDWPFLYRHVFQPIPPRRNRGDIIKSYYLLKETPTRKAGALLAVLFDRLIGLVALVTITAALICLRYEWLAQTTETRRYLWFVLAALGVSILALLTTFLISGFNLASRLPKEFPGREKLIDISAAYHLYARHWTGTLLAFAMSLVAHLATFATFLFVAYTLRANVRLIDFFAVMPIERTISAIPISFAGEGPREHVLQIMLNGLCGVASGVAALIGTMSFLVILFCSVPGAIVYFFYKPSGVIKHVKLREMREELAVLGHEISETE